MNKIMFFLKNYMYIFHSKIDKEIWKILPFRAKVGLIAIDVILWSIVTICIIILIRRYFFNGTEIHLLL